MFIGHLPAGYIITTSIQKKWKYKKYLLVGLLASIFPDIDILYFYFIDHHQTLHHSYWIHQPFWWVIISIFTALLLFLIKKGAYWMVYRIFFINIFLHLFLDTFVGKVEWLYPYSTRSFSFFEVSARYDWWIYNFVFHWTFLLELILIVIAVYLYFMNRRCDS